MKKIDWNHAVTRKDYAVSCGIGFFGALVIWGIGMTIIYWSEIKDWTAEKVKKVRSKLPW